MLAANSCVRFKSRWINRKRGEFESNNLRWCEKRKTKTLVSVQTKIMRSQSRHRSIEIVSKYDLFQKDDSQIPDGLRSILSQFLSESSKEPMKSFNEKVKLKTEQNTILVCYKTRHKGKLNPGTKRFFLFSGFLNERSKYSIAIKCKVLKSELSKAHSAYSLRDF